MIAVTRNPFGELIKDELEQISQRQEELKKLIENQSKEVRPLLIHPKIASEDKIMNNAKGLTKRLEKNAVNDNIIFEPSLQLVAGTGFEPMTFGL
ncbi:MAG: hypothetical protein JRI29_00055 [Deltaproteobacteria bacterium]|nr:hypothetical protein [Deltaproteobacteria bacterium]